MYKKALYVTLLFSGCVDVASLPNVLDSPSTQHPGFTDALTRQGIASGRPRPLSMHEIAEDNVRVNSLVSFCPDRSCVATWDAWLTPNDLAGNGYRGDCEDYVLAKYYRLRVLGVPAQDLRVAIVLPNDGGVHAVLGVRHSDVWYILDNLTDEVLPARDVTHYKAHVSFNEDSPISGLRTEAD